MQRLLVTEGPDEGRVFVLDRLPMALGRGYEADIRLGDGSVSRLQARVERGVGGLVLVDLGSTNGTRVNGTKIATHPLSDGDTLAFGRTVLRFETVASDAERLDISASIAMDSDERTLLGAAADTGRQPTGEAHRALLALYRADALLEAPDDLDGALRHLLDLCFGTFGAERGAVVLLDPRSGELTTAIGRTAAGQPADVPLHRTLLARVSATREALVSGSDGDGRRGPLMCAPLLHRDRMFGAIALEGRTGGGTFAAGDLRLFSALARKAALVIANTQLQADLRGLFFNTLEAIVDAIQMKDPYTRGHSERVRRYALLLARELDLPAEARRLLHISAVLHDVGKIGMPDRLLFNNDALTPEERVECERHALRGAQFIEKIPLLHAAVDGVKYHHENWDGTGYPDGLSGQDIPVQGRIVAVADTFDACTTDRPYQKGVSRPDGVRILRKLAGKRLDPALVAAFERALVRERLLKEPVPPGA